MQFNLDPNKQESDAIFSRKLVSCYLLHPPVQFNKKITRCSHQKYFGVALDSNLNFNTHIYQKIKKCSKIMGLITLLAP